MEIRNNAKNALCCVLMVIATADACRLWGVVAREGHTLCGSDSDNCALISGELGSFYEEGKVQPQGWSLGFYREGRLAENQTLFRSALPTDRDSARYANAVSAMLAPSENARCAIGHLRTATSGAVNLPDPHPFLFSLDSVCYSLVHNGTLDKSMLVGLLTQDGKDSSWLKNNPPHTYGNGDWQSVGFPYIVDSELLFLWLMKNIDESGDLLTGLAIALTRLAATGTPANQTNFILSDGKRLCVSGGNGCLYYRFGAGAVMYGERTYSVDHQAVMTEPPANGPSANLGWTSLQDYQLVELSADTAIMYSPEALAALAQKSAVISGAGRFDRPAYPAIATAAAAGYASLAVFSPTGKRLYRSVMPVGGGQHVALTWSDAARPVASAEGMLLYVLIVGDTQKRGVIPRLRGRQLGIRILF